MATTDPTTALTLVEAQQAEYESPIVRKYAMMRRLRDNATDVAELQAAGSSQGPVEDRLTTPPASPADGARYLVIATATGLWAGYEDYIKTWRAETTSWEDTAPVEGMNVWVKDEDVEYRYNGTAWAPDASYATLIADPGDGNAIPVTTYDGACAITTAGAETRTLAIPTRLGQKLELFVDTYVGNCVITVASAVDQLGSTTITMGAAGDHVSLKAITVGGILAWRLMTNNGCALT